MERIFELEFWMKWFMVVLFAGMTLMCFSGAFDRAQDIAREGRVILGFMGFICGVIATAYYRMEI